MIIASQGMSVRLAEGALRTSEGAISRRDFLRLSGVIGLGSTLAACAGRGKAGGPAAGTPVQLVYQDWRTEWFPPMAQAMLEDFHEQHPHIRVFYTPDPSEFVEQMTRDFRTGSAPDVFQGCCTHFPAWAQEGYTLDLSPYVEKDIGSDTIEDWDSAQYAALAIDAGQRFGLPKYHGALALYYNKDLFDEYGVDYPDGSWDHDDYLQAMRMLTQSSAGGGEVDRWGSAIDISWDRIQVHVNGWGGHLVDPEDSTRSRMADPEALAAVEWLRARILDDQVLATPFSLNGISLPQAFIQGRTAMIEDGSWSLKSILSGADFKIGVAPFPRGPARTVTIATTDGFGIYVGTSYPDEAWELMKFLVSPAYGRAMARANFLQPARQSLIEDWVGYVREAFPEESRDMDIAAFAEGHREGYSVTAEIFANMGTAQSLAVEAWDEILVLGSEPVSHLEAVSNEVERAQQEAE